MILKAGTYKFNDVLSGFPQITSASELTTKGAYEIPFIYNDTSHLGMVIGECDVTESYINMYGTLLMFVSDDTQTNIYLNGEIIDTNGKTEGNGYLVNTPVEITISDDTEVVDTFGEIFISNTNYNEVNAKPLATIEYNGQTIAQLNAGETCTIKCGPTEDTKYVMASDVVVKVNEVESKIPEGYIKPEGTLELVFNNIEAEFPIDCSKYAKVTVNTAEPLKISDPTVLDNITDSPWGVGGSVFLYEGATTDSYEKDALYYLEDTEK